MRKTMRVFPLILGTFFIVACAAFSSAGDRSTDQPTAESAPVQQPTTAPPAESTSNPVLESFEVVALPNAQEELKTDVVLRNTQSGEESPFLTLEGVYREHYHVGEYNQQNLYIIKRIGDVNDSEGNWTDELWRYDQQGNGEKLFSGKALDFRVAPDGQFIALQYAAGLNIKFVFLKPPTEVVKEFDLSQLDETETYYPSPETWNAQSSQFWGALHAGSRAFSYFRIDTKNWDVTRFDVSSLPINTLSECALNGNTEKLVFSDYPAIFDADSHQKFVDSQKPVNLFLFDLNSQASQTISTSQAKDFKPVWLDDKTVEFNDPNGSGRTTFILP